MAQSKSTKKLFNMAYGLGASIVIIGALFKILHWELGPLNGGILLAIGLLSFVVMILLISEKNSINKKQAKLITILDLGWVLVSILILLLSPQWFTSEGIAIVLIVATIVACLAYFQVLGLKKYNSI